MLRRSLIALLLLLGMPVAAGADASIGVVGGVNVADFDAEFTDMRDKMVTGVALGASFEIDLNEALALTLQPMYVRKGEKISDLVGPVSATFKPSYLEIPLMLKAYPVDAMVKPYLMVGPALGVLLTNKVDVSDGMTTVEADFKDITETTDWSIVVGGGVTGPVAAGRVFVDLRYAVGLTSINKGGIVPLNGFPPLVVDPIDVKNRGLRIMGGYSFPLAR